MNGVSIIVCCYNSSFRIRETLQHLFALIVPSHATVEIVLVDNNSQDNTQEEANRIYGEFTSPAISFRIVREKNPGLTFARSRGVTEARYDLILFCDDDNSLACDYLIYVWEIMSTHTEVAVVGGWCRPELPFDPGRWIEPNYTALALEAEPRETGYTDWVFGAGMVVRKRVFVGVYKLGIKFMLTGRRGAKQTSGDDAEICRFAKLLKHKVYYDPRLILRHRISANRLTRWSFIKANYRNVYMVVYFYILDEISRQPNLHAKVVYRSFVKGSFRNLAYYIPRMLMGRNNFFSFMMFFQNFQVLGQLVLKKYAFFETFNKVKHNLNGH